MPRQQTNPDQGLLFDLPQPAPVDRHTAPIKTISRYKEPSQPLIKIMPFSESYPKHKGETPEEVAFMKGDASYLRWLQKEHKLGNKDLFSRVMKTLHVYDNFSFDCNCSIKDCKHKASVITVIPGGHIGPEHIYCREDAGYTGRTDVVKLPLKFTALDERLSIYDKKELGASLLRLAGMKQINKETLADFVDNYRRA